MQRRVLRSLAAGTLLGTLILGIGGRLAMAAITAINGGSPSFTVGGTLTVVALGSASGFGGSILALVSRFGARRIAPSKRWPQHALFALLLLLVTLRGLRSSAAIGYWLFLPLVGVYGITLAILTSRDQSQRPRPRETA